MARTLLLLGLLCATAESGMIKRYHFVNVERSWYHAQYACRQWYEDLAFIDNMTDQEDLLNASRHHLQKAWIGLQRDSSMVWTWSGGRSVNFTNWAHQQPDNRDGVQDKAVVRADGKWNDYWKGRLFPFYCFSLGELVEEAKPWEEALETCRGRGSDLISLRYYSAFSRRDLQEQLGRIQTQRVWIGLRFLGDRWVWVNGFWWMPSPWSKGGYGEHGCPKRCGALTIEEEWEDVDCLERLPFICG